MQINSYFIVSAVVYLRPWRVLLPETSHLCDRQPFHLRNWTWDTAHFAQYRGGIERWRWNSLPCRQLECALSTPTGGKKKKKDRNKSNKGRLIWLQGVAAWLTTYRRQAGTAFYESATRVLLIYLTYRYIRSCYSWIPIASSWGGLIRPR